MSRRSGLGLVIGIAGGIALVPQAYGAATYTGSIRGAFSDEVKTGSYIDWRLPGVFVADNNAANATVNYNATQGGGFNNSYSWGTPFNLASSASSLLFTGVNNFPAVAPNTLFTVGQLTYTNGTIQLGTGTYGGKFTLSGLGIKDNLGGDVAVDPLTVNFTNYDTVNYNTTAALPAAIAALINLGGGVGAAWTSSDVVSADFFFIPDLNVYAFTREGKAVTFDIKAKIVGDPFFSGAILTVDPDSNLDGFVIGPPDEQQIVTYADNLIPEPASFAVLAESLVGLGLIRRRPQATPLAA